MQPFWEYTFTDSSELTDTFDELPLWSAPFGLLLLKHVMLKPGITVLDLGSGAGFPLLELAERLGDTCRCYGLDPWKNANERAQMKIKNYGVANVEVMEGSGAAIPLEDGSVDLVVSNLGINNFENPAIVFAECHRVLKPGGRLSLTTNLNGHWKLFYNVFESTLRKLNKNDIIVKLTEQQEHRGTIESISQLFMSNGLAMVKTEEDKFDMRFLNGSAFLHHHFIRLGWLSSWQSIIPKNEWREVFGNLEKDLNDFAGKNGGLTLSVPMAYMEGEKNKAS
jgi:arsenite methyltransferase